MYFDLTNGQVKECVSVTDFDDRFGSYATHTGSETTIELENDEFVEEFRGTFNLREIVISHYLFLFRRLNALPVTNTVSFPNPLTIDESTYISFPLALSLRYRWNKAKKLSISILNF